MDEPGLTLQFPPLPGEKVIHLGRTADGTIALTDYRLFLHSPRGCSSASFSASLINIPIASVESVEMRDIFYIALTTKESAQTLKLTFLTNEHCVEWHKRLSGLLLPVAKIERLFAVKFFQRNQVRGTGRWRVLM